ncbi:MAG: hemolysin activation/secretion protein, partial [Saprospiraceae bacterium]
NATNPTRGIIFSIGTGLKFNLTQSGKAFVPFNTELTIYESLNKKESIVFASKIGTELATEGYEFFQAPILGGNLNLRGYRSERFAGDGVFYHNNDLRVRLISSDNSILPFSFGISGGFDYGKVWLKNKASDTWHYGYGGGIWFAPIDFLIFSAQFFKSPEDQRLVVQVGHSF